jgi:tripartite-type tricarboxylate transporter receptor subunit TctC
MERQGTFLATAHGRARPLVVLAMGAGGGVGADRPVEFVVPAGTGGGPIRWRGSSRASPRSTALAQAVHRRQQVGGRGRRASSRQGQEGDARTIVITLSNLFTTPLHTGVPFNWKDLTPIARLALDEFILWVNAETPYKTAKDYLAAAKRRVADEDGGTGAAREDQILTIQLEQATGVKFT